jgi:hypothetical protein
MATATPASIVLYDGGTSASPSTEIKAHIASGRTVKSRILKLVSALVDENESFLDIFEARLRCFLFFYNGGLGAAEGGDRIWPLVQQSAVFYKAK